MAPPRRKTRSVASSAAGTRGKTRNRPRTRERRSSSSSGATGMIVVGLLAIAAGLTVVLVPGILDSRNGGQAPDAGRSTRTSTSSSGHSSSSSSSSNGSPTSAPRTQPSAAFQLASAKAEVSFRKADFGEAADLYEMAAACPAPASDITAMRDAAASCRAFARLTQGIETAALVGAEGVSVIELKNGARLRAKVTREAEGMIGYVTDNGVSGSFPESVVVSLTPVSAEELQASYREDLSDAKKRLTGGDGLGWYLLAVRALRYGFRTEAAECLRTAWQEDSDLVSTVEEHYARKLFKQGARFHALGRPALAQAKWDLLFATYPDTRAAASAQRLLDEARQESVVATANAGGTATARPGDIVRGGDEVDAASADSDVVNLTGKDQTSIDAGNKAFESGMALVRKGLSARSARTQNQCYKQAGEAFQAAVEHYEVALKAEPDNAPLAGQLQKAGVQLYWAKKMSRLD